MANVPHENGAGAGSSTNESADPIDLSLLAARWRSGREWKELVARANKDEMPHHLNPVNSSGGFNAVSQDKMSVQYTGVQQHGHDVGAVQANCPAPTHQLVYYFEMTVKNAGVKGQVSIGFTPPGVQLSRQPGWEPNSCGYHGDDGFIYRGHGKGESFGPKFTSGDTVGAGINYATQEFFFTKNGALVGSVEKNVRGPLFPTVAVHSQNEEVCVNFGNHPFLFKIEDFEQEERKKQQSTIDNLSVGVDFIHSIVRCYLLHYGYEDTLSSFDSESETALQSVSNAHEKVCCEVNKFALQNRKIVRELIRSGDIDSAFVKLRDWYPQVLQNEMSTTSFLLHCQRFIEYIRGGSLEDAVYYARSHMAKFFPVKSLEPLLQECIALLAYENPASSSLGHLLDMGQREIVADAVNASILSIGPITGMLDKPRLYMHSHLEMMLRQLTVCRLELQALNDNQGEAFYLHRALNHGSRGRGACD